MDFSIESRNYDLIMTAEPSLTLIFDLDGTLADTAPDLLAAVNHVLGDLTDELLTLDHARNMVGQGALALINEGLAHFGIARESVDIDALFEKFLVYYNANVSVHTKLFPGLDTLLSRHLEVGTRLGVCTNKPENLSRKLLRDLGIHDHFHTIVGRDTLDTQKPDPKTLFETIARAGGVPERSVFVGDSITDASTAIAAKVPCVLVSFGYTVEPVASLGGDIVIDHFSKLDDAIAKLLP